MTERAAGDIIAAAVARGAISAGRAGYWAQRAQAGEDITILDHLAAAPPGPDDTQHGRRVAAGRSFAAVLPGVPVPPGTDPSLYAANPLVEQMRRTRPALVEAAMRENPNPPRLFESGDLPPFTVSGLDPQTLAGLPWPLRRPVAEAPTLAAAYELVARYAGEGGPEMAVSDLGNRGENTGYVSAVSQWLQGTGGGPAQPAGPARHPDTGQFTQARRAATDYTTEALHAELFGDKAYEPGAPAVPEQVKTRKGGQ
jgi:hypothetical protein